MTVQPLTMSIASVWELQGAEENSSSKEDSSLSMPRYSIFVGSAALPLSATGTVGAGTAGALLTEEGGGGGGMLSAATLLEVSAFVFKVLSLDFAAYKSITIILVQYSSGWAIEQQQLYQCGRTNLCFCCLRIHCIHRGRDLCWYPNLLNKRFLGLFIAVTVR